jgi:membrane protein implicated in regulation of membrane protease activity
MNIKMKGNRGAGAALLFISITAFIAYAYFLLGTGWGILILQFTVLAAVAILLTVLGWIGYTMLTAPREEEKHG